MGTSRPSANDHSMTVLYKTFYCSVKSQSVISQTQIAKILNTKLGVVNVRELLTSLQMTINKAA